MNPNLKGFSLLELLVALGAALVLAAMMFHLFHQNERVVRDQTLLMEMQQTARIVGSQIADEIRMAGQGLPLHSAAFDAAPSEAVAVFLASSNSARIDFRAGVSNVETAGTAIGPTDFSLGVTRTLPVETTSGLSAGRFIYIFGTSSPSGWSWLRAQVTSASTTILTATPQNTVHFTQPPTVSLEEAASIYLSGGSVRRATGIPTSDPASFTWSPANELGRHFTSLVFTYYDKKGNSVQPVSLTERMAIARVDVQLTVEAASPLSDGTRPAYSLQLRSVPRNPPLGPPPM
jgi:hypothetical protein